MDEQRYPSNRVEYLTVRHMDTLDLTGLTPAQVVDKYLEIQAAISARFMEIELSKYPEL